jgi:carbonic anhydrase
MTKDLVDGFNRWRDEAYKGVDPEILRLAKEGQNPDHIIISCIDSRTDPARILDSKPGQFFGFKAMGAIVRPHQQGTNLSASLHFAIEHMKVPSIVLMGHTQCGAIKALVEEIEDPEINSFVSVARAGLEEAKKLQPNSHDGLLRMTEQQVVLQSMQNLHGYPAVKKAVHEDRLTIKGWVFDLEGGNLLEFNEASGVFEPITHFDPPESSHDHDDHGCFHS